MTMELEELKTLWKVYDEKLDKNLRLNMQLLRQVNLDKAKFRMRWLFVIRLSEMALFLCLMVYLMAFSVKYFSQPQFSIPATMVGLIVLFYCIIDLVQLSLIIQLQTRGNDAPIALLQRKIEVLKSLIVIYVKYTLLLIPLYPLLLILISKIAFNTDIFAPQHFTYLISNVIIGIILVPLFIWIYVQLSKKEIKPVWIKNVLAGSGWHLANDAQSFLKEIEAFEKE